MSCHLSSIAAQTSVRRLQQYDQPMLEALFAEEPGYTLFLSSNLAFLGSSTGLVRYWGLFASEPQPASPLAVLMMVGRHALVYASLESDLAPLAEFAIVRQVDFIMGQPTSVNALLQSSAAQWLVRREEHHLAAGRLHGMLLPPINLPPATIIRRAQANDLEALTTLYYRTDGFEALNKEQLRRVLYERMRTQRTWIAEAQGVILSAASTTAETTDAAMVGGVWTAPAQRGRGLSRAVVTALTRELLQEGRCPYLFYLTNNASAAYVYQQVGYQVIGDWSVAYLNPPETTDTREESS